MTKEEQSRLIAGDLLKIKAVFFRPEEPFTWASGIKSPVYCDNRLTLTAPEVRDDEKLVPLLYDASADRAAVVAIPFVPGPDADAEVDVPPVGEHDVIPSPEGPSDGIALLGEPVCAEAADIVLRVLRVGAYPPTGVDVPRPVAEPRPAGELAGLELPVNVTLVEGPRVVLDAHMERDAPGEGCGQVRLHRPEGGPLQGVRADGKALCRRLEGSQQGEGRDDDDTLHGFIKNDLINGKDPQERPALAR